MGCKNCGGPKQVPTVRGRRKKKLITENIDRFAAFTLGSLKDFVVFYELMETMGTTIEQVKGFIRREENREERDNAIADKLHRNMVKFMNLMPKCPECGAPLDVMKVNDKPCSMIGGKYKWLLSCRNWKGCGYERAMVRDINDFILESRRKGIKTIKQFTGGSKEN